MIERILQKVERVDYYIDWYTLNVYPGIWRSRVIGQGLEFDRLDEYQFGDDLKMINWPATARSGGQIIFKNHYLDTKNITVFILVDTSRSMDFGTSTRTKREISAELTAIITHSAVRIGDEVGLVLWPDIFSYPPTVEGGLFTAYAETVFEAPSARSEVVFEEVFQHLPEKRCLVFLISDFIRTPDLSKSLEYYVKLHDIVPIIVEDKLEVKLPNQFCFVTFQDMETNKECQTIITKRTSIEHKKKSRIERKKIRDTLHHLGVEYLVINDVYQPEDITEYFLRRRDK